MQTLRELRQQQPKAVNALTAAIASGRLHGGYVLVGRQASAARPLAMAAAQALVCTELREGSSCGTCAGCRMLAGANHPDVIHVVPNERNIIPIDVVRTIGIQNANQVDIWSHGKGGHDLEQELPQETIGNFKVKLPGEEEEDQ